MLKATCLCNSVRFEIHETPSEPTACHCTQCRKQTGHFLASANVQKAAIKFLAAETLSWFQSSEKVKRGFCAKCGSTLFWEPVFRDWTSVALGCIEVGATHLRRREGRLLRPVRRIASERALSTAREAPYPWRFRK
jgi:hypothetical protein